MASPFVHDDGYGDGYRDGFADAAKKAGPENPPVQPQSPNIPKREDFVEDGDVYINGSRYVKYNWAPSAGSSGIVVDGHVDQYVGDTIGHSAIYGPVAWYHPYYADAGVSKAGMSLSLHNRDIAYDGRGRVCVMAGKKALVAYESSDGYHTALIQF